MSLDLVNIVFGMKVRQARTEAGMTLSDLARESDLSASYLTEIEKGRKHPRADKIMKMAAVLGKDYDDLVSIRLDPSLRYLESTLSSTTLQRFPFEEFGLEASDALELLTREPERASALLHAILEIVRRYDLKEEDFIRAALRSYQEIHENYFPDLEQAALDFTAAFSSKYGLSPDESVPLETLEQILREVYDYEIEDMTLAQTPELAHFRAIMMQGRRPTLFINSKLYPHQIRFVFARELGYQYLRIKERSYTSSPDKVRSFQQLLNDLRAAYFGGVLLMPRGRMLADLERFFATPHWDPEQFSALLTTYNVTPEMLLYRLSELIPEFFGIKLHFLRFHHPMGSDAYLLIKQLNMNQLIVPSGIGLHEHYCRRWLSVRLLPEVGRNSNRLDTDPGNGLNSRPANEPMPVGVQLSEYLETQDRFLCMGFGRWMTLFPGVASSVIIGFRVDADLKNKIRFLDHPNIPHVIINETCERCPLTAEQCQLRAAPPTILQQHQAEIARKLALSQLQTRIQSAGK